jgi:hypothetical protein
MLPPIFTLLSDADRDDALAAIDRAIASAKLAPIEPHQHAFAMCRHDDVSDAWHAACANPGCGDDHFAFGDWEPIACAYCGSLDHMPIACPR